MGKYQARWYRTVKGEMVNGEMKWLESAVTHLQLKSYVARITKEGDTHKVVGVALNDGTPMKSVEVKVDDGPWQAATWDKQNTQVLVEALPLRLEGRHARRAHHRVARHRRHRPGAADREGPREQEVVPRAQRAAPAAGHDRLGAGSRGSGLGTRNTTRAARTFARVRPVLAYRLDGQRDGGGRREAVGQVAAWWRAESR